MTFELSRLSIGHFRVLKILTFKMRPSAQPFIWKWVLFAWEWKITSISKAEHLTSFWYRGPGGTRKWPITLQLRLPFVQVGPVLPFYLHLVDDNEAVNLTVVKFSVETIMRWLFWENRKKGKAGPILNVCLTEVSFNRKSTGLCFALIW